MDPEYTNARREDGLYSAARGTFLDDPRCRDRKSNRYPSKQADGEVGGRASA